MIGLALRGLIVILVLSVIALPAIALTMKLASSQPGRLKVVATFSIVGDLVQNVGGERIALTTLVGPDGDTERYEPNAADSRALAEADVIFENGLGSEPWLDRFYTSSRSAASRVRISESVDPRRDGQEV